MKCEQVSGKRIRRCWKRWEADANECANTCEWLPAGKFESQHVDTLSVLTNVFSSAIVVTFFFFMFQQSHHNLMALLSSVRRCFCSTNNNPGLLRIELEESFYFAFVESNCAPLGTDRQVNDGFPHNRWYQCNHSPAHIFTSMRCTCPPNVRGPKTSRLDVAHRRSRRRRPHIQMNFPSRNFPSK